MHSCGHLHRMKWAVRCVAFLLCALGEAKLRGGQRKFEETDAPTQSPLDTANEPPFKAPPPGTRKHNQVPKPPLEGLKKMLDESVPPVLKPKAPPKVKLPPSIKNPDIRKMKQRKERKEKKKRKKKERKERMKREKKRIASMKKGL